MTPTNLSDSEFIISTSRSFNRRGVRCRVSFWGTRIVQDLQGRSYAVHALADKILKIMRTRYDGLTPEAYRAGDHLGGTVNLWYEETDEIIATKNIFTRFFAWIQDFFYAPTSEDRSYLADRC